LKARLGTILPLIDGKWTTQRYSLSFIKSDETIFSSFFTFLTATENTLRQKRTQGSLSAAFKNWEEQFMGTTILLTENQALMQKTTLNAVS